MSAAVVHLRSPRPVVAVVGATGAVGVEILQCLEQRQFPLSRAAVVCVGALRGQDAAVRGKQVPVEELTRSRFDGVDIALFSAGGSTSKKFAPLAVESGAVVVDNSSAFRMDSRRAAGRSGDQSAKRSPRHRGIIANPNCAAIISITPLWPIHRQNRIQRLIISPPIRPPRAPGAAAMEELRESTRAYLEGREYEPKVLPHPYAFNALQPQHQHRSRHGLQRRGNQGHPRDAQDLRRADICGSPSPACACRCCARTASSMTFECERPITPRRSARDPERRARRSHRRRRRAQLLPDAARCDRPGRDSRRPHPPRPERPDAAARSSIFVAGDQLLKGAALNAVQIAEKLLS